MSGSETGLIASREAFGMGLQTSPFPSQPTIQNMLLGFSADGTAVYRAAVPSSPSYHHAASAVAEGSTAGALAPPHGCGVDMNMSGEPARRKRGRPRKYSLDGNMALGLTYVSSAAAGGAMPSVLPSSSGAGSPSSFKKTRGRPFGSKRKLHIEGLGSTGLGFTPHVITINAGEDVSLKIMSFSQHGPRAVCILSANGVVSNVTLRQAATSLGTVFYEGRFEILSLAGSFLISESGAQQSRTGGLSVTLAGPDGRVLGGSVAGPLTAAAPVLVVVGSFISEGCKESKPADHAAAEPLSVTPKAGMVAGSSPLSHGTLSESSGGASPPLVNHGMGAYHSSNLNGPSTMLWN